MKIFVLLILLFASFQNLSSAVDVTYGIELSADDSLLVLC